MNVTILAGHKKVIYCQALAQTPTLSAQTPTQFKPKLVPRGLGLITFMHEVWTKLKVDSERKDME